MLALITCFTLIPLAGLAVDIGMQRVARRDMQAEADTVALDMARTLGSGSTPSDSMATTSASRNKGAVGSAPTVHVYTGYIANDAPFVSDQALGCGPNSPHNDYFATVPAGQQANAVLVAVSSSVDFAIMGGTGGVCRSAIASTVSAACYDVGSYAAAVSTGNSALINPLFQQIAMQSGAFSNGGTVRALSYAGLAQSQVSLDQLAATLNVGSVSALATSTVKLRAFYVAVLAALVQPKNATSVGVLNALVGTASPSANIDLGKILTVSSGAAALADASMNALDLVGGSLAVLNGANVASINVAGGLPGVANANAQVKLIQGPHHFCGTPGSTATTATDPSLTQQLGVTMTAQLNPVQQNITVPGIPGLLGSTTATVALPNNVNTTVSVAPTSTTLTSIACTSVKGINLDVTNGLATVSLDTDLSNIVVNADVLAIPGLLSINAKIAVNAHVKIAATVSQSGVVHFSIMVPSQEFDTAYPTSNTGVGLGVPAISSPSIQVSANVSLPLLGIWSGASLPLSGSQKNQILSQVVTSVMAPMFDNTNPNSFVGTVINPVLGMLGTEVGGSDVSLNGKPQPTCGQPVLKG